MSAFQILCTTMNQTDFSKIEQMNIRSDVIFANQSNCERIDNIAFKNHSGKMITTVTRGVGVNRNLAMEFASADIILFSDDDMYYEDDVEEKILAAFKQLPEADVIIFGSRYTLNGEVCKERKLKTRKLPVYKAMKYGTATIAMRRDSVITKKLKFTELFGGGSIYSHGEDSDFILQCYRNKLKVYTHEYIIGSTARDSSSWFEGYTEKYFYDGGAFSKNSFGVFALPYIIYISFRIRSDKGLSFFKKYKCMMAGYAGFKTLRSYSDWKTV